MEGIFFDRLGDAFPDGKPTVVSVRQSSVAATQQAAATSKDDQASPTGNDGVAWSDIISAAALEDEVKRVRLEFESMLTTPGRFNSGGYLSARLNLTVLATLFAVIHQYQPQVRWKSDAGAARDLMARTAANCRAGSTQVFNEAKQRQADLRDILSGTGLASQADKLAPDWSSVADRSPLMEYAQSLIEKLEDNGRDESSVRDGQDDIRRNAQLLAMLGSVLTQDGINGSGDDDYEAYALAMTKAASGVSAALEQSNFESARLGITEIRSSCDNCHSEYR